jgi:hypothetical protein
VLLRPHDAPDLDRREERALQVHVHHLVELGLGEGVGRTADVDAGPVDQDVDAAHLLLRPGGHRLHRVDVGDVGLDGDGAAAGLADQFGGLLELRGGARGERDVGAVMGEGEGHAEAQAAAAAGHERHLAIQPEAGHLELVVARTRAGRHIDGDCSLRARAPAQARAARRRRPVVE